jgi:hypothetical protein
VTAAAGAEYAGMNGLLHPVMVDIHAENVLVVRAHRRSRRRSYKEMLSKGAVKTGCSVS